MKKLILVALLMGLLSAFTVSAADTFVIYNKTTSTDLVVVDNDGLFNVTTGKIAEQGVLLEDIYCALSGTCSISTASITDLTVTNSANFSGATVEFDDNQILESKINFTTAACGAGNHLDTDGAGGLTCVADSVTDTIWGIDNLTIVNESDYLEVNTTYLQDQLLVPCGNISGATSNLCTLTDTTYTANETYINLIGTVFTYNETVHNASIAQYLVDNPITETDTLQDVTGRGSTTTDDIVMNGGFTDYQGGYVTSTTGNLDFNASADIRFGI